MRGVCLAATSPKLNNSNKGTKHRADRRTDCPSYSFLNERRLYRSAKHEAKKDSDESHCESPINHETFRGLLVNEDRTEAMSDACTPYETDSAP